MGVPLQHPHFFGHVWRYVVFDLCRSTVNKFVNGEIHALFCTNLVNPLLEPVRILSVVLNERVDHPGVDDLRITEAILVGDLPDKFVNQVIHAFGA